MQDTIFMIHGMWGGGWIWENLKDYFSDKGYNCINPSLPYHEAKSSGEPPASLGKIGLYNYLEFLKNEIAKLDNVPIVFGHSMGGLLAQILTSQGYAKSTVLFNPVPPGGISSFSFQALRCMKLVFLKSLFLKPHLITFTGMKYSAFNMIEEKKHLELYNKLVYDSGRAFLELAIPEISKKKIAFVDEKNVKSPILVIGSKHDRTMPVSIARKIAKKYPTAGYKEFPDNAHWIIIEDNWKDVAEFVEKWILKFNE
ncbi:MAG: alpha/beta fold hydrolase [bacterium]